MTIDIKKHIGKKYQTDIIILQAILRFEDDDNYIWVLGRSDDILKVSGHRLGTIELESAFISHQAVGEAAVTSKYDDIKGESIIAFLVLKSGINSS